MGLAAQGTVHTVRVILAERKGREGDSTFPWAITLLYTIKPCRNGSPKSWLILRPDGQIGKGVFNPTPSGLAVPSAIGFCHLTVPTRSPSKVYRKLASFSPSLLKVVILQMRSEA